MRDLNGLGVSVRIGDSYLNFSGLDGPPPAALQPPVKFAVLDGLDRALLDEGDNYPGAWLFEWFQVQVYPETFFYLVPVHDGELSVVVVEGRMPDGVVGLCITYAQPIFTGLQEGVVEHEGSFSFIPKDGGGIRVVEEG